MSARDHTDRFREELADLRSSGCSILVVGEVPTEVSRRACHELSGGASEVSGHQRVVVDTGGGHACDASEGERTRSIEWADQARGATVAAGGASETEPTLSTAADRTTVGSLPALLETTLSAVETAGSDAEPGDLRLCVDSLGPLVEGTSERAVFKSLHQVNAAVRAAGGIGHVHLPVGRESEQAELFEALFDVTVELDLFGGEARQRWYLHDAGIVSDWLPIGVGGR